MHIAVVDDERLIRKDLGSCIRELRPDAVVWEAENGEAAVKLATEHSFDIFFLDINLGDMNGTVLAMMLEHIRPDAAVIFVTAYSEYGVKAFELNAVDYVMKPFGKERIEKALKKAEAHLLQETSAGNPGESRAPSDETAAAGAVDTVIVRHGKGVTLLNHSDIVYIESKQHICKVCSRDGNCYVTAQTLQEFVKLLESGGFMRIHKSFLVNLDYILEIAPLYNKNYSIRMRGYEKEMLPVGRNQLKQLREKYRF